MTTDTAALAHAIAEQATKLRDLAALMDDAEGTRSGNNSGIALILKDVSLRLYEIAHCTDAERLAALAQ